MHDRCPREYYLKYIAKCIPRGTAIYFQVGSAGHDAVAKALMRRKTVTEMLALFQVALKKEGVSDPDTIQYQTMIAMKMFTGWYSWYSNHEIKVLAVEQSITKDSFLGIIDCVAEVDGVRYVIDWKTSARPYDQTRADTDGQVTAYTWLASKYEPEAVAYGVMCKGTGEFQFLASRRTKDDVAEFLSEITTMRQAIATYRTEENAPKNTGTHCKRCDAYACGACEGRDDF